MFSEFIKNPKFKNKLLSSDRKPIYTKIKNHSKKNLFPPIKRSNDIYSKIKRSTLSGSINILYKSLFPDERNTLDAFLNSYHNKYIVQPKWKFTNNKTRNDDKIREEFMKTHRTMRSYEFMRKPTKLKKIKITKPKMVQIVENNFSYKYRYFLNPWEEEYNLYRENRRRKSHNKYKFEYELAQI